MTTSLTTILWCMNTGSAKEGTARGFNNAGWAQEEALYLLELVLFQKYMQFQPR